MLQTHDKGLQYSGPGKTASRGDQACVETMRRNPPKTSTIRESDLGFCLQLNSYAGQSLFHTWNGLNSGSNKASEAIDIRGFEDGDRVIRAKRHVGLSYILYFTQLTHHFLYFTGACFNQYICFHDYSFTGIYQGEGRSPSKQPRPVLSHR